MNWHLERGARMSQARHHDGARQNSVVPRRPFSLDVIIWQSCTPMHPPFVPMLLAEAAVGRPKAWFFSARLAEAVMFCPGGIPICWSRPRWLPDEMGRTNLVAAATPLPIGNAPRRWILTRLSPEIRAPIFRRLLRAFFPYRRPSATVALQNGPPPLCRLSSGREPESPFVRWVSLAGIELFSSPATRWRARSRFHDPSGVRQALPDIEETNPAERSDRRSQPQESFPPEHIWTGSPTIIAPDVSRHPTWPTKQFGVSENRGTQDGGPTIRVA